jgi:hypothetical protein
MESGSGRDFPLTSQVHMLTLACVQSITQSRMRQCINPSLTEPPVTGICAFRFTLEKRLLENLPGSEWIMHQGLAGPRILLAHDDRRHVFMYAIKCPERGEVLNVAVICEDKRDQSISSQCFQPLSIHP